jgi:type IV pilus assembly protein PilV
MATALAGHKFERGLSMFEILITILVVSIGLLGLAGLQFAGLRAANSAQEHTLATLLAQDIEERIRANGLAAAASDYNNVALDSSSSPAAVDCVKTTAMAPPCSELQMAKFDIYQWYRFIVPTAGDKPRLPNAAINITSDDGTDFLIVIQWGDPSGPQTLSASFTRL